MSIIPKADKNERHFVAFVDKAGHYNATLTYMGMDQKQALHDYQSYFHPHALHQVMGHIERKCRRVL